MNIGLIAMSGIRACNTELLELGLTLPGFVERSKVIASLPSLGLLTLAGMTPKHHTVEYLEIADLKQLEELPTCFDLVAISSFSAQIGEAYELADRLRAVGTKVVLGGLHVTSLPDEAAEHADAVVIGEGEMCWDAVLLDAESGQLKGRYEATGREFDFAHSPMPAFELLDIPKYNRLTVQTSRGCPWKCSFCASSILLTKKYKQKPIERVLAEIDRIRELWPRPFIEFADDNAFVNKRYWRELLPYLRSRRIKWFAETDISLAEDESLLEELGDSGCAQVLIGLESPSLDGMSGVELKRNWKLKQVDRYLEGVRRIQSHGIRVNGCFVLGLDGQGPEVFDAVYRFVEEAELFDVQVTVQTPFPGTPLYERLLREGRILEDCAWHKCTLFDVNFQPTHMSVQELEQGLRDLMSRLYCESFTAWRRETFHRKYRRRSKQAA